MIRHFTPSKYVTIADMYKYNSNCKENTQKSSKITFSPEIGSMTGSSTSLCLRSTLPRVARKRILSKAMDFSLGTSPVINPNLTCLDASCKKTLFIIINTTKGELIVTDGFKKGLPVLTRVELPRILHHFDLIHTLVAELQHYFVLSEKIRQSAEIICLYIKIQVIKHTHVRKTWQE